MSTRLLFMVAAVLLATISASCSRSGPGLYPVHGTVTYKGQPAEGAVVYFHQQGGSPGSPRGLIPTAVVDSSGKFSLDCGDLGSGAPAGKYVVLVQWPDESVSLAKVAEANAKTSAAKAAEKIKARKMKLDTHRQRPAQGALLGSQPAPVDRRGQGRDATNCQRSISRTVPHPPRRRRNAAPSKVTEDRG